MKLMKKRAIISRSKFYTTQHMPSTSYSISGVRRSYRQTSVKEGGRVDQSAVGTINRAHDKSAPTANPWDEHCSGHDNSGRLGHDGRQGRLSGRFSTFPYSGLSADF